MPSDVPSVCIIEVLLSLLFQIKPTRSPPNISSPKPATKIYAKHTLPSARTTLEFADYYRPVKSKHQLIINKETVPLVNPQQMRSWGVNPNILRATDLNRNRVQNSCYPDQLVIKQRNSVKKKRVAASPIQTDNFRKTTRYTSYLKQYNKKSAVSILLASITVHVDASELLRGVTPIAFACRRGGQSAKVGGYKFASFDIPRG